MNGRTPAPAAIDLLAALLAGEARPWRAFGMLPEEFLRLCTDEGLVGLMYARVIRQEAGDWPPSLVEAPA